MTIALTGLLIRSAIALLMVVAWLERTLRPRRSFPRDPAEFAARPEWALEHLRRAGVLAATDEVVGIHVERVKQQEAFRSQVARVDVRLADGRSIALMAKFAPQPESLREHAVYLLQQNAPKEVAIYHALGERQELPLARCYAAEIHALSGGFCLLLERLEPLREIPESDGCPAELAERAMDAFATLHAATWNDETTEATTLARTPPAVVDWLAAQLPGPDAAVFATMLRTAWHHDAAGPCAILHSDARVGNMLFPTEDGRGRFAFIDWQAARRGRAIFDVAYFFTLSLEPEVRRSHGDALLLRYHTQLCAAGVADYPLAAMCEDFRMGVLLTLGFVTLPLMSAEASRTEENLEGIDALGTAWARRMVAVVEELDFAWVATRCGVEPSALQAAFERSNDGAVRDFPVAARDREAARQARARHGVGVVGASAPETRVDVETRVPA